VVLILLKKFKTLACATRTSGVWNVRLALWLGKFFLNLVSTETIFYAIKRKTLSAGSGDDLRKIIFCQRPQLKLCPSVSDTAGILPGRPRDRKRDALPSGVESSRGQRLPRPARRRAPSPEICRRRQETGPGDARRGEKTLPRARKPVPLGALVADGGSRARPRKGRNRRRARQPSHERSPDAAVNTGPSSERYTSTVRRHPVVVCVCECKCLFSVSVQSMWVSVFCIDNTNMHLKTCPSVWASSYNR